MAAGALPWRVAAGDNGDLEVLLIHRPRYDDWSWPKGKIDPGETVPECAAREVEEEIGLKAPLGIPLPSIHYHVAAGLKVVHYWAVDVDGSALLPDGKEVDSVMWCSPEKAARLLSNPSDVGPLEHLAAAHARGELKTWPLVIVRHAKAKPRSSWSKAEGDRPLAATGMRQAQAVGRLLQAWKPMRIVSSPWLRCVATIAPYAKASDAKVKLNEALTEHRHGRHPHKTAAAVEASSTSSGPWRCARTAPPSPRCSPSSESTWVPGCGPCSRTPTRSWLPVRSSCAMWRTTASTRWSP